MLASDIFRACYIEGDFVLRSGRHAKYYFDKYQFEADPKLLSRVADALVPLIPADTEVLAGLEMGGVPVVTALSRASGLSAAFIRKVAKEHGTAKLAEGAELNNRRVTIVEDVVTSGGQIVLSASDIRAIGGIVGNALCVVDRQEGGFANLRKHGIKLTCLFTASDLTASESGD
jgi:orotate phosphoribosyltransferase